jgi:hypothetical protein
MFVYKTVKMQQAGLVWPVARRSPLPSLGRRPVAV